MFCRHGIKPSSVCEVGCGAGEVLKQLQHMLGPECEFIGYDISPQAIELAASRQGERLRYVLGDATQMTGLSYDAVLVLDVVEHLEDYFNFLRRIKPMAKYKVFEIPLDLSVQTVMRVTPLLNDRQRYGHIHYFNKETALQLLADVGYEIVDHFYTAVALERPNSSFRNRVMRFPRRLWTFINEDMAVRFLGGCRMLILTR